MNEVTMTQALRQIALRFAETGESPHATCTPLTALTGSDLYRIPQFARFSVGCQLSEDTDDGSRRSALRRREVDLLAGTQRGRVLDLMCGVGNYVAALDAEGHQWTAYLGVDVSTAAIDEASSRFAAGGAEFRCADVLADGAFTGPFDTVLLCYEALNALAPGDAKALLNTVASELAPGGQILLDIALSTPIARQTWRTAELTRDPFSLAGSCVAAITSRAITTSATQNIVEHDVHLLTEVECRLHFAYQRWEPSAELLDTIIRDAGLRVRDHYQVHHQSSTEKSAIRLANQFVLELS